MEVNERRFPSLRICTLPLHSITLVVLASTLVDILEQRELRGEEMLKGVEAPYSVRLYQRGSLARLSELWEGAVNISSVRRP